MDFRVTLAYVHSHTVDSCVAEQGNLSGLYFAHCVRDGGQGLLPRAEIKRRGAGQWLGSGFSWSVLNHVLERFRLLQCP